MKNNLESTQCTAPLEADVIVVGAGPAGIGAAVTAARQGMNTLLIEANGYPGGMATAAEVHPFMANHKTSLDPAHYQEQDECFDRPVYLEWLNAMRSYLSDEPKTSEAVIARERFIDKNAAILAAEDLLLEAGVTLAYHHQLFDVKTSKRNIDHIILFSKSGLTNAKARIYIDCTGDGDLGAKAGCDCEIGNRHGQLQPMTLSFKLENVDTEALGTDLLARRRALTAIYVEAKKKGEVDCPRDDILVFDCFEDGVLHFNTTRVNGFSGISGMDLAKAEIEGRRQMRQIINLLKTRCPACQNARIRSMGAVIGVRETRRIKGRAYLTRDAYIERKKYPDAIARCGYPIDIHIPGSSDGAPPLPRGEWYEIPYGCIVANDLDNLLLGGRLISSDHAINGSLRVMPPTCTIGQAAGMAAAMSINENLPPFELNGEDVRKALAEFGAHL